MSNGNKLLAGLLCFQIVLASGLFWRSSNSNATYTKNSVFLATDGAAIDAIEVNDGTDEIDILKRDGKWMLSGTPELPADISKVDSALETLTNLSVGLPVASNSSSREQLKVADKNFQRRVVLRQGGDVKSDLLLGTSPGFKKSHIRKVGEDEIYAAKVNVFDLTADKNNWFDKNLLQFDAVTGLKGNGLELKKSDNTWQLVSPVDKLETHQVSAAEADSIVASLNTLRVNRIMADEADMDATEDGKTKSNLQVYMGDKVVSLEMIKAESNASISRDDMAGRFAIAANVFDSLLLDENKLLVENREEEESGSVEPSDSSTN